MFIKENIMKKQEIKNWLQQNWQTVPKELRDLDDYGCKLTEDINQLALQYQGQPHSAIKPRLEQLLQQRLPRFQELWQKANHPKILKTKQQLPISSFYRLVKLAVDAGLSGSWETDSKETA